MVGGAEEEGRGGERIKHRSSKQTEKTMFSQKYKRKRVRGKTFIKSM